MKYTIELTNKQKAQMDCMMEIVHRYVGFNPKLEPVEYSSESQLEEHREQDYDRGYKQGIADYRKFERFFDSDGIDMFEDIRNPDGTLSMDMILLYLPMSEIMARIRAYEDVKSKIKVGDEVITPSGNKAIITRIDDECITVVFDDGSSDLFDTETFRKTGRHFDEVKQLLDKLRGEK